MDQEQADRILLGRILLTRFTEAWSLMTLRKRAERDPRTKDERQRRMDGAERIKMAHAQAGSQSGKAQCKTLTVDLLYFRLEPTTP